MKLTKILESVLGELNEPKPEDAYPFDEIKKKDTDNGSYYTYVYTNTKGDQMEVTNMVTKLSTDPGKTMYVAFKKHDPTDRESDVYRIMATITHIVKKDVKQNHADVIEFTPSKRTGEKDNDPMANVRTQLYSRYIKSQWPNAEVTKSLRGDIKVILNP